MLSIDDRALSSGVPLVRVRIDGVVDEHDSRHYFEWFRQQSDPFLGLWDCTGARVPGMGVLRNWASWMNANRDPIARLHGLIFVIPSPAVRGAMKFCIGLAIRDVSIGVVHELGEGIRNARTRLSLLGVAQADLDEWLAAPVVRAATR